MHEDGEDEVLKVKIMYSLMWNHFVFAPAILNQISNIYFEHFLRFGADLQLMLSSWLLYLFLSKFGFGNVITCPSMQMVIRTQKTKTTINTQNKKKSAEIFLTLLNCWKGLFRDKLFVLSAPFFLVIDKKTSSWVENLNHIFIWTLSAVVVAYL